MCSRVYDANVRPRRPDPITITNAEHAADPQRYSRLVNTGVVVTLTDDAGGPYMQMSNGGPPMHTCRTCGEYTDLDDEAAEDEHVW